MSFVALPIHGRKQLTSLLQSSSEHSQGSTAVNMRNVDSKRVLELNTKILCTHVRTLRLNDNI